MNESKPMKTSELIEKAAKLYRKVREGQKARAEIDAITPQVRAALGPLEGKVIRFWGSGDYEHFLVKDGCFVTYTKPEIIYASDLDKEEPAAIVAAGVPRLAVQDDPEYLETFNTEVA